MEVPSEEALGGNRGRVQAHRVGVQGREAVSEFSFLMLFIALFSAGISVGYYLRTIEEIHERKRGGKL